MDATRIKQVGGTGDDWRVHLAYDLRACHLIQVHVTDKHTAESLQHFQLQRFDLLIADRGYGYRKNIAYAYQQQNYVILRSKMSLSCLLVAIVDSADVGYPCGEYSIVSAPLAA